jgi:orotidine-5'-phosphate decarboxylase
MDFNEKLMRIISKNKSLLCVGLDIDKDKIPKYLFESSMSPYFEFNKKIIDVTKDLVCSYKLNMAFYEVLGKKGMDILEKTIEYIPEEIIIILDGKRNDIHNSARMYARSLYETFKSDGVTVNPYLGIDGIKPFLDYDNKCCFILCRTSNPSSSDIQDLKLSGTPLYEVIASKIKEWDKIGKCGAVVGATYPEELRKVRAIIGDEMPVLIPGIGTQGGDLKKTVEYGTNKSGDMAIIVSSRAIIYGSCDKNFAKKASDTALFLRNKINQYRK